MTWVNNTLTFVFIDFNGTNITDWQTNFKFYSPHYDLDNNTIVDETTGPLVE
jgi:hypothetical protein